MTSWLNISWWKKKNLTWWLFVKISNSMKNFNFLVKFFHQITFWFKIIDTQAKKHILWMSEHSYFHLKKITRNFAKIRMNSKNTDHLTISVWIYQIDKCYKYLNLYHWLIYKTNEWNSAMMIIFGPVKNL